MKYLAETLPDVSGVNCRVKKTRPAACCWSRVRATFTFKRSLRSAGFTIVQPRFDISATALLSNPLPAHSSSLVPAGGSPPRENTAARFPHLYPETDPTHVFTRCSEWKLYEDNINPLSNAQLLVDSVLHHSSKSCLVFCMKLPARKGEDPYLSTEQISGHRVGWPL